MAIVEQDTKGRALHRCTHCTLMIIRSFGQGVSRYFKRRDSRDSRILESPQGW
jgi:hypothetical protein